MVRLGLLGAATAAFQTLFAREFLSAFSGNEAVVASMLGPWLLWTGVGAHLGARRPKGAEGALLAAGLGSAASLLAARALPAVFELGAAPGAGAALGWAALLLGPACLASGLAFARLASGAGPAYLADALGAAIAGAALSLVLLDRVPTFAVMAGATALFAVASVLGAGSRRAGGLAAALALALGAAALPWAGAAALRNQGSHLGNPVERASAAAALVVAEAAGQKTLYADRVPIVSGADPRTAEEAALLPLGLLASPRTAAVVGVPPTGALEQMIAAGIERPVLVLEDPALLEALRLVAPLPSGVEIQVADARRFLKRRPAGFDLVVLEQPEPTSAQLNRFFTEEFFQAARGALRLDGVFVLSLPGHAAYAGIERRRLHSSVARTLEAAFGHVLVLPAGRTVYVASERALPFPTDVPKVIAQTLAARGVSPKAMTRAWLDAQLSPARQQDAQRWASLKEPINRDLEPTTHRVALDLALAQFGDAGRTPLLVLALALALGALMAYRPRARPVEFAVLTSGAAGLAGQLTLMLAYQIAAGALYREIGLLLAGFMLGAAAGAGAEGRGWFAGRRAVLLCDALQIAVFAALALALPALVGSESLARPLAFAGALAVGVLPGAQFAAAGRALGDAPRVAGTLYAADLAGASLAALVTFAFLVPALGARGALWAVALLKVASAVNLALPASRPAETMAAAGAPVVPTLLMAAVLAAAAEATATAFYAFTFWRPYPILAAGVLWLGVVAAFEPPWLRARLVALERRLSWLRERARLGLERAVAFAVLLPAGAFPLGRCYFHVPYVFCHVCPRPCVFGVLRPYLVPAALIANLYDRRFCEKLCPLGAAQAACDGLRKARARRVRALALLRLAILAFVAISWFLAREGRGAGVEGGSYFGIFFRNAFAPSGIVLVAVGALIVLSIFVRRPFCDGMCPIGAASDLLAPLEKRIGRGSSPKPESAS